MRITETNIDRISQTALETLESGGIVAYPTETFYALGVRFDIESSLHRLYDVKKRPRDKAMPIIIGSTAQLSLVSCRINETAEYLIERFWPGPLTLLVPAKDGVSEWITSGSRKVAVRIPGESFALHLAKCAGFPITSTSANPSGSPPAMDTRTVREYFPHGIDLIVDGGNTPGGLPSTIVDTVDNTIRIVRKGAIEEDMILPQSPQ
ncbi:MAG TPA: L-threonylcarbamoyladenylate synthase [Thermodesulfovibrionales bacterium]|nr:L-threonylcarbamoyladenylate synthase [Thermodesulfovibrionales bacterium]